MAAVGATAQAEGYASAEAQADATARGAGYTNADAQEVAEEVASNACESSKIDGGGGQIAESQIPECYLYRENQNFIHLH